MNWSFSKPQFDFFDKDFYFETAWNGHYHFVYDLVSNLKSKTYVELGSHYGHSLYAAAQAVKDHKLPTEMYGVDGWEGDAHAGYYGDTVYNEVLGVIKRHYSSIKLNTKRMYFNQAVKDFTDASIDILHIDGLHTYEAVKEDFETWLPKMKSDGVILFHDTAERQPGFGVWKLWEELEKKYPANINFQHSHGLGVIFLSGKLPWDNTNLYICNHYQKIGGARTIIERVLRDFFKGGANGIESFAVEQFEVIQKLHRIESHKIMKTYRRFKRLLLSIQK